jgi:RimJ/RimL family protein N-acetyltransferase
MIELISPFPADHLPLAWSWLRQFPECNFDDYGPKSLDEFIVAMRLREASGEKTWGVRKDNTLVGIVGYAPQTPRMGWFHGICFTKSACDRETPKAAVSMILQELFEAGVEKVSAAYFADNHRVDRFLKGLGAREEGYFLAHTLRDGSPIDMRSVAIFKQ